jgi:adenylate cyclase
MAFWNAPVDVADHPGKAVRAALGMRETLARLNADDAFGFGSERKVGIGIGIHTGLACVGNMGAESRFNYSAVGDAVNIAARIESSCKEVGFDILVTESTASSLKGCALLEAGALALKGKSGRTSVFAVVGDERVASSAEFAELQAVHAQLVHALQLRPANSRKIVNAAKLKAAAVMDGLQEFYAKISRRPNHFSPEPAVDEISYVGQS